MYLCICVSARLASPELYKLSATVSPLGPVTGALQIESNCQPSWPIVSTVSHVSYVTLSLAFGCYVQLKY